MIKRKILDRPQFPVKNKKGRKHMIYNVNVDHDTLEQLESEIEWRKKEFIKTVETYPTFAGGISTDLTDEDFLEMLKISIVAPYKNLFHTIKDATMLCTLLVMKDLWNGEKKLFS